MSDTAGRSGWQVAQEPLRWSGERWVPAGLGPAPGSSHPAERRSRAWGIAIALLGCLFVVALGILSLVFAVVGQWRHVSVSPTRAVVAERLSRADCNRGQPLVINIVWHGRVVRTEDDGPSCSNGYVRGQRLTVYVGSDSPADVGPDANWILNPDTHNPFDFFGGPNDIGGSLYFFGVILILGGSLSGLALARWARRPRAS